MAISTVKATINGETYTLSLNSSTGDYEAQITAPGSSSYNVNEGHYYPVTVTATDAGGNSTTVSDTDETLGDSLKLQVKDTVVPVITISAPTEGQYLTNNTPVISWTVTDDDSGVNPDTIGITIDEEDKITSGIAQMAITGGYSCSYTLPAALDDGTHTIYIDAEDYDGNAAVQRTVNFTVDTVPPELSITSPDNNLVTNVSTVTVAGTTNDVTSSPVTLTVTLNEETPQEVDVGSNGAFSTTLTLPEGVNTITIVAEDAAGKSSTVVRTVTLDIGAPVISDVTLTPNPVSTGEVFTITVKVTD